MLIFDYDVTDPGPETLQEAMSYAHTVRTSAFLGAVMRTNGQDRDVVPRRFTRKNDPFMFGADPRLDDVGSVFISVDGAPTNALGEVWVDYEVQLYTPQMPNETLAAMNTYTPTGDAQLGFLVGVTADRSVVSDRSGIPAEISNGVIKFLDTWSGTLSFFPQTAGACGDTVVTSPRSSGDSVLSPMMVAKYYDLVGSASVKKIVQLGVQAFRGTTLKVSSTNSTAHLNPCVVQASPADPEELRSFASILSTPFTSYYT